jgi:hypothetical protein
MDADEERHIVWDPSSSLRVQRARSRWTSRSYHPEYVGLSVLSLFVASLGLGALALQRQGSEHPFGVIALPFGLMAFGGGLETARFYGHPIVPPAAKAREFRARLIHHRLRVGGPGLLFLAVGFGVLVYSYGTPGFAVGAALWAFGLATGSGVYAFTSRVRCCSHCRYFITFRRFEGQWACTTCGRPLEEGVAPPAASARPPPG